jgi:hypothetical protein
LSRTASKLLLLSIALAVCPLLLGACGDDDGGASDAKKVSIEATGSGKNVSLKAPRSIEGGLVEISFKNSADSAQEAQLVRVEGDHSVAEVLKVIGSEGGRIPGWMRGGGGVGTTEPGQTANATQDLPGGKYYVVGAAERGKPPTAALTVEGGGDGDLPETEAKITAKDYSFAASGLKGGRNEILVENTGRELHHVVALPMRKGATLADVREFARSEGKAKGPPPVDEKEGRTTAVIDSGVRQVVELELKSGNYALLCFITDRKGGPPHVAKGMVAQATVR